MPYDTSEVKSVQAFLNETKKQMEDINQKLPEGEKGLNFDVFQEKFFQANEGLLKNRDTLKEEKAKWKTEYDSLNEKFSSIDPELPNKYNDLLKEHESLKGSMQDGNADVASIEKRFRSDMEKREALLQKKYEEEMNKIKEEAESYKKQADTFSEMHKNTLKREGLKNELKRISVRPEDEALIMQANLSRAKVVDDDSGSMKLVFVDDEGHELPSEMYWDNWASKSENQRYILAAQHTGGGAAGGSATPSTKQQQLLEAFNNAKSLPERMRYMQELEKLNKQK